MPEGEAEPERDFEHELFQRPNPDSPKVEKVSLIFAALDKQRQARLNRALSEKYAIEDSDTPDTYLIKNGSGRVFVTALTGDWGYCSCEDFQFRGAKAGMPCKHLYALEMHLKAESREAEPARPSL